MNNATTATLHVQTQPTLNEPDNLITDNIPVMGGGYCVKRELERRGKNENDSVPTACRPE